MTFQIGTDEAGYGPNFGPLTVTGTLWSGLAADEDLYDRLATSVTSLSAEKTPSRLMIADSKRVYGSTKNLRDLELPVLAILHSLTGTIPRSLNEMLQIVSPGFDKQPLTHHQWLADRELKLPVAADIDDICILGDSFSENCFAAGVKLKSVQCVAVLPDEFNTATLRLGNKATVLSTTTLKIVRKLLNQTTENQNPAGSLRQGDVQVGCDKHGGRSKYAALIQDIVTEEYVTVGRESLEVSEYSFREQARAVTMRFSAKGESFLPTALASMVSKYVREIFMKLWNNFWIEQIPGIKPTQGYPQDAKRFKREIAEVQLRLGILDETIWRMR